MEIIHRERTMAQARVGPKPKGFEEWLNEEYEGKRRAMDFI